MFICRGGAGRWLAAWDNGGGFTPLTRNKVHSNSKVSPVAILALDSRIFQMAL
jgi:hypothetical protein